MEKGKWNNVTIRQFENGKWKMMNVQLPLRNKNKKKDSFFSFEAVHYNSDDRESMEALACKKKIKEQIYSVDNLGGLSFSLFIYRKIVCKD